jgi:FlaA1/EpsC-like NDP-sugar epimerase
VLQAAAMGRGGEIFVLEMGEQIKIVDLARDLVRLSGLPRDAIEIVFTGIRPGEKLYEELYFDDEQRFPTGHPKLHSALHRPIDLGELRETLMELQYLVDGDADVLLARLKEMVPEFVVPEYSSFDTSVAYEFRCQTQSRFDDMSEVDDFQSETSQGIGDRA